MPADKFAGFAQTPTDPAQLVFDVTPSDTTDLSEVTTALNVATLMMHTKSSRGNRMLVVWLQL